MRDAALRHRIALAASVLAGAAGAAYGFAFGLRLGSIALGLLTAANCAVLGAFAVGGVVERLLPAPQGGPGSG